MDGTSGGLTVTLTVRGVAASELSVAGCVIVIFVVPIPIKFKLPYSPTTATPGVPLELMIGAPI